MSESLEFAHHLDGRDSVVNGKAVAVVQDVSAPPDSLPISGLQSMATVCLQLRVFAFLTAAELATFALVCKEMAALVRQQNSWKGVFASQFCIESTPALFQLLPRGGPWPPQAAPPRFRGPARPWRDLCHAARRSLQLFNVAPEQWQATCFPTLPALFQDVSTLGSDQQEQLVRTASSWGEEDGEREESLWSQDGSSEAGDAVMERIAATSTTVDDSKNAEPFDSEGGAGGKFSSTGDGSLYDEVKTLGPSALASSSPPLELGSLLTHPYLASSLPAAVSASPALTSSMLQSPLYKQRLRFCRRVARFLFRHRALLHPRTLSNYMSNLYVSLRPLKRKDSPEWPADVRQVQREATVLFQYVNMFNWRDLDLECAVRALLSVMSMPSSGRSLQALLSCFAYSYFAQNYRQYSKETLQGKSTAPDVLRFTNGDAVYRLVYCLLVLNTDQHALALKEKLYGLAQPRRGQGPSLTHQRMSLDQWIASTQATRSDIPSGFRCQDAQFLDRMASIYHSIQRFPMMPMSAPTHSGPVYLEIEDFLGGGEYKSDASSHNNTTSISASSTSFASAPSCSQTRARRSWKTALVNFFARPFAKRPRRMLCKLHNGVLSLCPKEMNDVVSPSSSSTAPCAPSSASETHVGWRHFDLRSVCQCSICEKALASCPPGGAPISTAISNSLDSVPMTVTNIRVADESDHDADERSGRFLVCSLQAQLGDTDCKEDVPSCNLSMRVESVRVRDEWLASLFWHTHISHLGRFGPFLFGSKPPRPVELAS